MTDRFRVRLILIGRSSISLLGTVPNFILEITYFTCLLRGRLDEGAERGDALFCIAVPSCRRGLDLY